MRHGPACGFHGQPTPSSVVSRPPTRLRSDTELSANLGGVTFRDFSNGRSEEGQKPKSRLCYRAAQQQVISYESVTPFESMGASAPSTGAKPGDGPAILPGNQTAPSRLDDYVRTAVAGLIVFIGVPAILVFWIYRPVADAQAFSTVMTGVLGVVLGYYFGAQGKSTSDASAKEATEKLSRAKTKAGSANRKLGEALGRADEHRRGLSALEADRKLSPPPGGGAERVLESIKAAQDALGEV